MTFICNKEIVIKTFSEFQLNYCMISLTLGARDRQSLVGETEIKHTSITYYCDKCFEEQLIGDPESD